VTIFPEKGAIYRHSPSSPRAPLLILPQVSGRVYEKRMNIEFSE